MVNKYMSTSELQRYLLGGMLAIGGFTLGKCRGQVEKNCLLPKSGVVLSLSREKLSIASPEKFKPGIQIALVRLLENSTKRYCRFNRRKLYLAEFSTIVRLAASNAEGLYILKQLKLRRSRKLGLTLFLFSDARSFPLCSRKARVRYR